MPVFTNRPPATVRISVDAGPGAALDGAGRGRFEFKPCEFVLSSPLKPRSHQTWAVASGAEFKPRGDNSILSIENVEQFSFFKEVPAAWGQIDGKYWIRWRVAEVASCTAAPAATRLFVHRTSTAAAIVVDDLEFSHARSIWIRDYFDAVRFAGTDGTRENDFDTIYGQVRNDGLTFSGQCHDNHFKQVFIKGPSPYAYGHSTGNGFYMACAGTKGGNSVDELQLIDMGKGVNLPGASEVWFGTVLVDNPRDEGITVLGDCERLFFDKVWASSGGDGLVLCGEPGNPLADVVSINQLYAWLNAGRGVYVKHDVSRVRLGCVWVTRNGTGFEIEGPGVSDIKVSGLSSWNNTTDLDCSGADGGIDFGSLTVGAVTTLAGIESIGAGKLDAARVANQGTATVPGGSIYVDVEHGLGATPPLPAVQVTPAGDPGSAARFWISDAGPATFRINVDADPGPGGAMFVWRAAVL